MSKPKYTRDQRKQAFDLYWKERGECLHGRKPGMYSLSEISQITGIERSYVSRIARGLR